MTMDFDRPAPVPKTFGPAKAREFRHGRPGMTGDREAAPLASARPVP
jgi:hypothetical protein